MASHKKTFSVKVAATGCTQITIRSNSDDLRPTPLPSNKKSLEFTQAVLKHSFAPSKIADLVKCLRETRSDVQMCLTELETTFQHVQTLYTTMGNGLARISSRTSIFSTATNLTVRIELAARLKRWEETWGISLQHNSTSVSCAVSSQTPFHLFFLATASWLSSIQTRDRCWNLSHDR